VQGTVDKRQVGGMPDANKLQDQMHEPLLHVKKEDRILMPLHSLRGGPGAGGVLCESPSEYIRRGLEGMTNGNRGVGGGAGDGNTTQMSENDLVLSRHSQSRRDKGPSG